MEQTVINQIKSFQVVRKLTTKELAEKAGLSRTGLSQILNGRKSPTLATLVKLCAVMGLKLSVWAA